MAFDQSAGVLTLDPDEVETSPAATALDPSEVEDAPSQSVSSSAQPLPTPETAGGGSRYEANIPNPFPRPAVTPLAPAGAAGPLPGIPQPQVDMQAQPLIQTIFGTDPVKNARIRSEVQDPGYLSEHPPQVYDYGQNAIPRIQQGVKEAATPGQRVKGATDIFGGVNDAVGSSLLPLGSAPAGVAAGAAASMAGGYAAPALVKAAGGTQEQQDLAREVGTALPMAAGVGADLVRGRASGPEILPPEKPDVYVPPSNRSLSDMTVEQGDTMPQKALAAPEEIAQHPAGKVTGIDVHTGLPLVDRTQPSEVPFSARGEELTPQTGTAGPMSPEAEAISTQAAESSQPALPEPGQEESQLPQVPQGDDLSTKLASVGLHGEEASSILDMYGLDPSETSTPEDAQNAAAKPWEEQVRDAYITLADQRGIPVASKDDLFRDQNTARDARNAVEQVISHVHSDEGAAPAGEITNAQDQSNGRNDLSRPIEVQTNFPPPQENSEAWNRAANNSAISSQFSRLGIAGFSIDSPHEFGLSEQANVDPDSGQIRVSAAAHDPEQSIAHELAHDIYNRLSPQNRELVDGYIKNSTAHSEHAGGLVERMADHFGDVMAGKAEAPATVRKAFFDSELTERPAGKARPSEAGKLERPNDGRKSWTEIARAGGSIHQGDDLEKVAREHGEFPIVIKDTFAARHVVPASVAGELSSTEASGYIREMWMAKDHVREEGNPEGKLARNEQMLSADRYFNALKSKDEIDPNSRPLDKPYRAELEQQNADLRAEIARRKSGEKYAPKPAYPPGTFRIDDRTGARPLTRALKTAENRQRLTDGTNEIDRLNRPAPGRAMTLSPDEVEDAPGASGTDRATKRANDRIAQGGDSTQQASNQLQAVLRARPVLQPNNQALIPGRRLMPARSSGGPVMPGRSLLGPSSPALTAGTAQAALRPAQPIVGQLQPAQGYSGRANLVPAETATGPRVVLRPAVPGFANTAREPSAAQGENKKPQSQTMYSGAAVFDPEAWKTLFPDVAERFSDWVNDKQDEGDLQRAIMRETRGELDRKVSIAAKQLEKVQRDFRLRPRQDALNFFNAAEGVTPMSSIPAKDQALAATFKGYFDKMKADLQSLNPNVLRDFIENYFPHIWERPSRAATVFTQVLAGKRPFAGSGSFLKQRTIPTIQDGLALGLKPVSYNPVDLFLAKYHEMSRFLMGHKTLGMMKDAGTAKLVRPGTTSPDGWTQLDDRIGTVMSKDDDGHLFIRGHYYAPAPAADVFNAYVSKGLAGRSAIFDILQAANNRLNALQLGISAFHATTTAVNAAASDIALGTQQLTQGRPLQALKNLAEGVTYVPSMISTFRNGSKLMKEYLSPGSYAKFAREANAVSLAGGRIRQNTLEIKPLTQALDDLKAGAIGSAMKKTIPALIDASSRPIMEQWVPRMKLGAFYGMANNILDTADREGWSQDQTRTRMQTAWDSIDNRFGQMVYDNLFWNKALRDVLMASTRSVGWNAGTIRELGGATVDAVQQAGKVASGKAPELTDRMSFAIGMTVSAGLLGSAIYYLLNGEAPHSLKDAYFPGKSGEARMSVPGYMKDVVAYGHDPKQTILNKMSPVLNMLSEALENRDFYGTEIRHPDDPVVQQLWQLAKFAGAEAVPFSMRGVQKLVQQKGSLETSLSGQVKEALRSPKELAAGQFGFQPAPAYIQNSPALNRAHAYDMANMPPGTRTQEQAEKQRLRAAITIQYRNGHPDHAAIENLVREGKLTQKEVNSAIATAKTDPLLRAARPLHLDQLLNVYADANQAERRELRPVIARKGGDVRKEMDPQRRAALRAALENVLRKGNAGQDSGSRRNVAMP